MKSIHLLFVLLALAVFISRVMLVEFKPALMQIKFLKIAPHIIASLIVLSGIILTMQGNWLAGNYGWIVTKFVMLLVFIGLGIMTIKNVGIRRWSAFIAALACFFYIIFVAITKHGLI